VLSDRLKKLEQHGLVARTVYSQHPLRAQYHLTAKGESLKPVLDALVRWGYEHCLSADERERLFREVPAHLLPALQ
jgi:DNA-binding HxlR family transcriptional regulator